MLASELWVSDGMPLLRRNFAIPLFFFFKFYSLFCLSCSLILLGDALGSAITDLSIYGCYKITDVGVMFISKSRLMRFNYCGCYKVTDAGRRRLISVNPRILTYNRVRDFGKPHPSEVEDG
jgi:hypothetical protein